MISTKQLGLMYKEVLELDCTIQTGPGPGVLLHQKFPNGDIRTLAWGHNTRIGGLTIPLQTVGYFCIEKIEIIIRKYYEKYQIDTLNRTIFYYSMVVPPLNEYVGFINSTDDMLKLKHYLKSMVYEEVIPWLEKYQTIEQVYEKMLELEKTDSVSHFLSRDPNLRSIIIKRLMNAKDFEEFAEYQIGKYQELSVGSHAHTFGPVNQFLPELVEELKQMKV
jgi:hypothetical protein